MALRFNKLYELVAFAVILWTILYSPYFTSTEAYNPNNEEDGYNPLIPAGGFNPLDPDGNVTIIWDVVDKRSPDNYTVVVSIFNFQPYREIRSPGWGLSWMWNDVDPIWSLRGAQMINKEDCSQFKANPYRQKWCEKYPNVEVADLTPEAPHHLHFQNSCKGGVIRPWSMDPSNAVASFELFVAASKNNEVRAMAITSFGFRAPGAAYRCGGKWGTRLTPITLPDGTTEILSKWEVVCKFVDHVPEKVASCCTSFSSSNNNTLLPCPSSSCGNQNNCSPVRAKLLSMLNLGSIDSLASQQCPNHMCPAQVHWHLKETNEKYWHVELKILTYDQKFPQWSLLVEHPNFDNTTQIIGSNHKFLTRVAPNDNIMLWGDGPLENVKLDLLISKKNGSALLETPRIFFNGDTCAMPPRDHMLSVLNAGSNLEVSLVVMLIALFSYILLIIACA